MTSPLPLPIPGGAAVLGMVPALRRALDGAASLIPYAEGASVPAVPEDLAVPDGLALCVGTSGSTGEPKLAMLTAANLIASATATHDALGGTGQWLLPMPAHHIAGLQVLVRSIVADTEPVVMDLAGGFTAEAFGDAARRLEGARRYTALVPTQLGRLLADPAGIAALRSFDAVLVGGAATPPGLLAKAKAAGVRPVPTYGMSETAGGCVYAGRPLACSRIRADVAGRLHLGGETIALGYLGQPDLSAAAFRTDEAGTRWFATDDVGHQDAGGQWHVDGRLDDLINTGGLKVAPRVVEDALLDHIDAIREAVVVGVTDPEWGEAVAAAVVLNDEAGPAPTVSDVREALRRILPDHALPQRLVTLSALPLRGPGKPDRAAIREVLEQR